MPAEYTKHKSHIMKVMFLCCVGRPKRINGVWEDTKVGCWPIVGTAQQKKRGKRARGEWKFVKKSIDYELYKQYLIEKVLPMLRSKLPRDRSHNPDGTPKTVYLQDDGASPHKKILVDPDFLAACTAGGFHFEMRRQPAQSPDLNILDLGFFAHLQAITYHLKCDADEKELIRRVFRAWNSSKPEILNDLFLTLQSIMKCIIEQGGKNDYKFPRLHKDKLKNRGLLPQHLKCNVFEMTLLNGHITQLTEQVQREMEEKARDAEAMDAMTIIDRLEEQPCPDEMNAMTLGVDYFWPEFGDP